jgi:hypothetical protein
LVAPLPSYSVPAFITSLKNLNKHGTPQHHATYKTTRSVAWGARGRWFESSRPDHKNKGFRRSAESFSFRVGCKLVALMDEKEIKIQLHRSPRLADDGRYAYVFDEDFAVRSLLRCHDVSTKLWESEIASMICPVHFRHPESDYKQEFTPATRDQPFWGKIVACCDEFAGDVLVRVIEVSQKGLRDGTLGQMVKITSDVILDADELE